MDTDSKSDPARDDTAVREAAPPPASDTDTPQPEKWWKRRAVRVIALRLLLRLIALAVFITILRIFGSYFRRWGNVYLDWVHDLGTVTGPVVFLIVAIAFCSVSPTGYLPSVMAGVTFSYAAAIPISYLCVFLGAMLNLVLVRAVLGGWKWLRTRCMRRAGAAMSGLEQALAAHPIRIVTLLRLPFLGNGTLNYVLSFRCDVAKWLMANPSQMQLLPLFPRVQAVRFLPCPWQLATPSVYCPVQCCFLWQGRRCEDDQEAQT